MEQLKPSKFSAAGDIANERLVEAASDPGRYPQGTTFIAADQEGFGSVLAEAVSDHRPVAIVYPDGREIVAAPRSGTLGLLEHWMTRRHGAKSEGVPSTPLPADYQVEIREPLLAG